MYLVRVANVNKALPQGLRWLTGFNGQREESRNGPVLVSNSPVTTIYDDITHRVLFAPLRDANPFFHVMEALWMLGGRNDLAFVAQFNKQMRAYSDDGGVTQPAAYGNRWRSYFGYDQLRLIVDELRQNPESRRCVLAMWNGGGERDNSLMVGVCDLFAAVNGSKDVPCNTQCYFRINGGRLDMMVTCRSNDIWWGAYGANSVHFSILLEYMAAQVGVLPGKLTQVSFNYHLYPEVVGDAARIKAVIEDAEKHDYYTTRFIRPMPLVADPLAFDAELPHLLDYIDPASPEWGDTPPVRFTEPFFTGVALPMFAAWQAFKAGDYLDAETQARRIHADDWRVAATDWLERRAVRRRMKEAGL